MNSYQKKVNGILDADAKPLIVAQPVISSTLKNLLKKFKYYRLSLYTFSLASFVEILLSGNFSEENINNTKSEIESLSMAYRNIYAQCSLYLERMGSSALETNVLKGIGTANKTAGKIIGSIPIIKEGPVDELLVGNGSQLNKEAAGIKRSAVESFAEISNPGIGAFIEKMDDMIRIYNRTEKIYFDDKFIYLAAG